MKIFVLNTNFTTRHTYHADMLLPAISVNQFSERQKWGRVQKSLNWKIIPWKNVSLEETKLVTDTFVLFFFSESKQINTSKDYTLLSSSLLLNTTNSVVSWVSLFCLKCDFSEAKGKFDCKHTSFDIRSFQTMRVF